MPAGGRPLVPRLILINSMVDNIYQNIFLTVIIAITRKITLASHYPSTSLHIESENEVN